MNPNEMSITERTTCTEILMMQHLIYNEEIFSRICLFVSLPCTQLYINIHKYKTATEDSRKTKYFDFLPLSGNAHNV